MTTKDTTLPEAGICNGTALRKATRRVSQLYDAVLAPSGLRGTQRSIAHNLKPLERDGLVVVRVDPADKRSRLVALTPLGKTKLHTSMDLWREAQHRFEAAFGPEQSSALRAALGTIASPEFAAAFEASDT